MTRDEYYNALSHSAKGTSWKKANPKYTSKENGRYKYNNTKSFGDRLASAINTTNEKAQNDQYILMASAVNNANKSQSEKLQAAGKRFLRKIFGTGGGHSI